MHQKSSHFQITKLWTSQTGVLQLLWTSQTGVLQRTKKSSDCQMTNCGEAENKVQ